MSGETVLAIDLGTSACKASLVDVDGNVRAAVSEPVATARPRPGWAEQGPEAWWGAAARATRAVLAGAADPPAAVAVVGQMSAWLGLDAAREPVAPALIWADLRATEEAAAIAARLGERRVYELTGNRINATYPLARWLWMRRHAPQAEARAVLLVQPKDYLVGRLTDAWGTDPSDASCTLSYDLAAGTWSREVLDAFSLDVARLPEVRPSTSVVGHVTAGAAAATGLRAGTPVVAGGGDGPAAAVGAGAVAPGEAYLSFGTSAWISQIAAAPVRDPAAGVVNYAHLAPGTFAVTASTQNAGLALDWALATYAAAETAAGDADAARARIDDRLRSVRAGADGLLFLPHLQGERTPFWDAGLRGALLGLTAGHDRWQQLRAVHEGVAHQLRALLDALAAAAPAPVELRFIGGGGRSAFLTELIAEVLGVPLRLDAGAAEATSLGGAQLAAVGIGLAPDLQATRRWVRPGRRVEVGPEHAGYARRQRRWAAAVARLAPFHAGDAGDEGEPGPAPGR